MASGSEVVILGGGVIGLTAAYFLAREGVRVRLLERGQVGRQASWAGAGILPPSDWVLARKPFDRLRALSGRIFPELSDELRHRSGINNEYVRCGGIEFASELDVAMNLEWSGEGIVREPLDERATAALEPALARGLGPASHLATLAQVRNPRHLQALRGACLQTGNVQLEEGIEARACVAEGNKIRSVTTSNGTCAGDAFVVAAGAWADHLLASVGKRMQIRPVRGQIALLNPGAMVFRKVLIWGTRYLVPRCDGRVLVGSTEEEAGYATQTTTEGIRELLRLAVTLVPALAGADVERCWAGLRPRGPDQLPIIGRLPDFDNLYIAGGHFRAGIQLSPGTGQLLKELLLGQPLTMPLEAFRPERTMCDD